MCRNGQLALPRSSESYFTVLKVVSILFYVKTRRKNLVSPNEKRKLRATFYRPTVQTEKLGNQIFTRTKKKKQNFVKGSMRARTVRDVRDYVSTVVGRPRGAFGLGIRE